MFKKVWVNYRVMKEKTLLKIALIGSLLGILILFIISNKLEVNERIISEIDESYIGSNVRINGVVLDVQNKGSIVLIDIAQLEEMHVVVFDNVSLAKGDYVEITGKIEEYEGEMELIADKIILK